MHNSYYPNKKIWTPEEDEFLKQSISKTKNWTTVSKEINKNFKKVKRTTDECRARFRVISKGNSIKPWSKSEELVLLLSLHLHQASCQDYIEKLLNRGTESIREYFVSQVKRIIGQIKNMDKKKFKSLNPIEQLKLEIYLALLLTKPEKIKTYSEIANIKVTEDSLKQIGFENIQILIRHIDSIIEKLQNNIMSKLKDKAITKEDLLNELFHKQPEEYPRQEIYMHILPAEEVDRDYFLIAVYLLPN